MIKKHEQLTQLKNFAEFWNVFYRTLAGGACCQFTINNIVSKEIFNIIVFNK